MSKETLAQRIARRHMQRQKQASVPDLVWGIDQLKGAAQTLQDIVAVWERHSPGTPGSPELPSLAETYKPIAKASKTVQGIIKTLESQADELNSITMIPQPIAEVKRVAKA